MSSADRGLVPPGEAEISEVPVALPVEDEGFGVFGQALGDDLGVEGVGKDLGPILERSVGGDGGGATDLMALGDDLKGELCLGGIHGEHRKIVDDEQVCADVFAHGAVQAAM